jgi:hypothetical protein
MPLISVGGPRYHYGLLLACLNSLVLDYVLRQKASGGNLNFFIIKQLPVPSPTDLVDGRKKVDGTPIKEYILKRVVELVCTTNDLAPFAADTVGESKTFSWNADRRFQLQCELDALFFHIYGTTEDEVEHILDSFPVVRNAEVSAFGNFRTKETVLSKFKSMAI